MTRNQSKVHYESIKCCNIDHNIEYDVGNFGWSSTINNSATIGQIWSLGVNKISIS